MPGRAASRWTVLIVGLALLAPAVASASAGTVPRAAPVVGGEFLISDTAAVADEASPAVASSGTGYLVVWEDLRDEGTSGVDVYGQLLSATGAPIGHDFRISDAAGAADEQRPAVAWNGSEYLVVWEDLRKWDTRGADIYGRRVSAAGALLAPGIRMSGPGATDYESEPAIAWSGSEYLVVWRDERNSQDRGTDIHGRLVSAAGAPTGFDARISGTNATADEAVPDVAWSGSNFLVVWQDSRNSDDRGDDVRGRLVSPAGTPLGRDRRISGTNAIADDLAPALAGNGTDFLVVWEDWRMNPGRQTDIYARLVSSAGAPIGANFRVCGPGAQGWDWAPAIAWDAGAGQYLVVWQDERNWDTRGADIYGRRVDPTGARIGGDFRVSGPAATAFEYQPEVAWSGTEHLVVWQDARGEPTSGRDVWGRRVDLVP
ncbi:MAG: hypothetical protein ABIJ48_01830 [Actinomycetota bacterium]